MSKIEELKQLMSIEGCNTAPDIKRHFDHIAKLLFECFVIEYEGSLYLFKTFPIVCTIHISLKTS